jgi:SH3-like domain-containing protein
MRRWRHWFSVRRELKLARMLTSVALFLTVALASLGLTAFGLKYSADMIGQMAAATPVKTTNLRPGYVARPTIARANDLNVARSVPVVSATADTPIKVAPPGFTHSVTVEALKVRAGPKQVEPQVFTLKGGSWVNISDEVEGWVRITDEAGQSGWVYGSLLRQAPQAELRQATQQGLRQEAQLESRQETQLE